MGTVGQRKEEVCAELPMPMSLNIHLRAGDPKPCVMGREENYFQADPSLF